VRPDDMVVRLGGDEFVVLCHAAGQVEATRIAERLQASVRRPVALEGAEVVVSASVGVVVADGEHSAEGLLRDADVAMYQAKQAGKARFAVFDERVREGLQDRLRLTADLRRAVAAGELGVVYQPVWDVRSPTPVPVGLEALVRWAHPVRGAVPPTQIITLADENGMIDELGALVLRRACTDLAAWKREVPLGSQLAVGVNLCTSQLRNGRLVEQVGAALADAGLEGADLWLELTENVVMDDIDGSSAVLDSLRALGVRLVVDDFGTGYSSLAYLHRLPVQAVKIDRRFVGRLEDSASDAAIVAAIVAMADALGLTPIAEGVERPGQLSELIRLGCAQAQGYLLSRPVPAAEVPAALVASALVAGGLAPSSGPPARPLRRVAARSAR
jgi:predicted signal transduction protein with EAL and GGDEF domain